MRVSGTGQEFEFWQCLGIPESYLCLGNGQVVDFGELLLLLDKHLTDIFCYLLNQLFLDEDSWHVRFMHEHVVQLAILST